MAPKRKAPEPTSPAKRAKAEAAPKGRAKAEPEAAPKGRAKAEPAPVPKGRAKAEPEPKGRAKAAAATKAEPALKGRAAAKPAAARAKPAPPPAPRLSEADLEKELQTMIQSAKDGEFDKVFKIIDKYPPYVNERPEERRYSTIHQACYWGDLDVAKKLVEKYNADVFSTTKDGHTCIEVAKEHGHGKLVTYLEEQVKKKTAPPPEPAGGRSATGDRSRISATRADGCEDADMELSGISKVMLRLGAECGGILCGAAMVYGGKKRLKAVSYTDRSFKKAITHSGDCTVDGKRLHTINMDLAAMPKEADKIYLTLCSCGVDDLQKFKNPSVELLGDSEQLIRYDLNDAGDSKSTIMAVLEKSSGSWVASPVGAVSPVKFCGNYSAAGKLVDTLGDDSSAKAAEAAPAASTAPASRSSGSSAGTSGDGYTPEELASMEVKKELFSGWTNDKLKNMLKDNDQSRTGNKAVLLAKCAYGAAFGKLGRCPKCFGGKVKFRIPNAEGKLYSLTTLLGGATGKDKEDEEKAEQKDDENLRFYCTGYFDDDQKVECDWQAKTAEHETWTGL